MNSSMLKRVLTVITTTFLNIACAQDIPIEIFPDSLTHIEYAEGKISNQEEVRSGDSTYDALYNLLKQHQHGWTSDLNTYAPNHLFKAENININCGKGVVVVNYRSESGQWKQISKNVVGCEDAILK